jgi:hypothetical protein
MRIFHRRLPVFFCRLRRLLPSTASRAISSSSFRWRHVLEQATATLSVSRVVVRICISVAEPEGKTERHVVLSLALRVSSYDPPHHIIHN